MITISLCMIVKNEEHTIQSCLESVKSLVEEIVIVDTGSTDWTKKSVSQYTDRILDFKRRVVFLINF
jgi:glycosyltransferase involved in cell wall biosynthesis